MQQRTSHFPKISTFLFFFFFFWNLEDFAPFSSRSPKRDEVVAPRLPRASTTRWDFHVNTVFEHRRPPPVFWDNRRLWELLMLRVSGKQWGFVRMLQDEPNSCTNKKIVAKFDFDLCVHVLSSICLIYWFPSQFSELKSSLKVTLCNKNCNQFIGSWLSSADTTLCDSQRHNTRTSHVNVFELNRHIQDTHWALMWDHVILQ